MVLAPVHAIPVMVPAEAMVQGVAVARVVIQALDQEAERVLDRVVDPAADQEVALAVVQARDLAVARVLAPAEVAADIIRPRSSRY